MIWIADYFGDYRSAAVVQLGAYIRSLLQPTGVSKYLDIFSEERNSSKNSSVYPSISSWITFTGPERHRILLLFLLNKLRNESNLA